MGLFAFWKLSQTRFIHSWIHHCLKMSDGDMIISIC